MDIQLEKYTVDFRSITYIDREAEAEAILQSSLPHIQDLSIDLEWDPNGNGQRVDIISIAWRSRMLIIHVSRFKNYSTEGYSGNCLPTLGLILADDHITKFSVNMRCDAIRLFRKFGWKEMRNLVDLAFMALACQPTLWHDVSTFAQGPSLYKLVLRILRKVLDKEEQCSNWSQELTPDQITYSACDAQAGLDLFEKLVPIVQSTPRNATFHDSYTFAMHNSKFVFTHPIDFGGTVQHTRWKMYSKEFDEAHGIKHISYLQDRADKSGNRKKKHDAKKWENH